MLQDGVVWLPVAALGDGVLLMSKSPEAGAFGSDRYEYFDPPAGSRTPLWVGEPDRQDAVRSADGDWIATIRTGRGLPFDDWRLLLRNWRTGEVRELAKSDPRVAEYPGLHIGLPSGFAPTPSVRDGLVAWDEYFVHDEGVGKRIQQYDIASNVTTTLHEVPDARLEELLRPTTSRGTIAWIHIVVADEPEEKADMTVDLLDTRGNVRSLVLPGEPYIISLSSEGNILYWSTLESSQYATALATLETTTLARDIGAWVYVSGHRVGWVPQIGRPGSIGYYDETTDTTYIINLITDDRGGLTTLAQPLGRWFAWSVRTSTPNGDNDLEASSVYFLALD